MRHELAPSVISRELSGLTLIMTCMLSLSLFIIFLAVWDVGLVWWDAHAFFGLSLLFLWWRACMCLLGEGGRDGVNGCVRFMANSAINYASNKHK